MIQAEAYTPGDDTLIPTGELSPVEGTAFDFRAPKAIGADLGGLVDTAALGYDHNYS